MSLNWPKMITDLTMEEYLNTDSTDQRLWQANASLLHDGSTPATGQASLFHLQGTKPKSSSRLKAASQIQVIQQDLAKKIQALELLLNEQTPSVSPPIPPNHHDPQNLYQGYQAMVTFNGNMVVTYYTKQETTKLITIDG